MQQSSMIIAGKLPVHVLPLTHWQGKVSLRCCRQYRKQTCPLRKGPAILPGKTHHHLSIYLPCYLYLVSPHLVLVFRASMLYPDCRVWCSNTPWTFAPPFKDSAWHDISWAETATCQRTKSGGVKGTMVSSLQHLSDSLFMRRSSHGADRAWCRPSSGAKETGYTVTSSANRNVA